MWNTNRALGEGTALWQLPLGMCCQIPEGFLIFQSFPSSYGISISQGSFCPRMAPLSHTCRFSHGSCGYGGVGGCIWLLLCEPVLLHQHQAGGCHHPWGLRRWDPAQVKENLEGAGAALAEHWAGNNIPGWHILISAGQRTHLEKLWWWSADKQVAHLRLSVVCRSPSQRCW